MNGFKDHFSQTADTYKTFRPLYPNQLFEWLASLTEGHDTAWDCGCGNGQAALGLTPHYRRIIATDPSAEQIRHAVPHPQIDYRVAAAEASGLSPGTIDLIVVAQALHWFDLDRFYAEARRTARPGAVLAAFTYGLLRAGEEIDEVIAPFYRERLAPYWPAERRHVDDGYRALPFPFAEITPPDFALEARWDLDHFLGYLGTWSAVKEYRKTEGRDPLDPLAGELSAVWGKAEEKRAIRWPIALRVGRI